MADYPVAKMVVDLSPVADPSPDCSRRVAMPMSERWRKWQEEELLQQFFGRPS